MRLLVVDDDRELSAGLAKVLRNRGYAVDTAHDGEEADDLLRLAPFDLLLLDRALPRLDGFGVLRRLRQRGSRIPVILLTADPSLAGRVKGLDGGADDCLIKPFAIAELEARIRAQLRRAHGQPMRHLDCGDLRLDTGSQRFTLGGKPLTLTPREQSILEKLMHRQGSTLTKEALASAVYGFDDEADPNAIEIYVHRLRRKLEGGRAAIATLRRLGYMLHCQA